MFVVDALPPDDADPLWRTTRIRDEDDREARRANPQRQLDVLDVREELLVEEARRGRAQRREIAIAAPSARSTSCSSSGSGPLAEATRGRSSRATR